MRDALDAHVAGGGNAAIFSGNTCFWQIRFEDDGRAMTCFKYRAGAEDPVLGTAGRTVPLGDLVGSARRPARDVHDRAHVHARRLLALRARRAARVRRLHGGAAGPLGVRGHRPPRTATRSASATRSSRTRSTAARSRCRTAGPSPRTRTAAPRPRDPGDRTGAALVAGGAADPLRARARRARARRDGPVRRREPEHVEQVAEQPRRDGGVHAPRAAAPSSTPA